MSENPIIITKEELTKLINNLDIEKLYDEIVRVPSRVHLPSLFLKCQKETYQSVLKELGIPNYQDVQPSLKIIKWRHYFVSNADFIDIESPKAAIRVEKTNLVGIRKTVAFLRELQEHSS